MDIDWNNVATGLQAVLEPLIRQTVAQEVAKALDQAPKPPEPTEHPKKLTLGYSEVHKLYGIGRDEWNRLINKGEMIATKRRMRGGRDGWVVAPEEAARVLGG